MKTFCAALLLVLSSMSFAASEGQYSVPVPAELEEYATFDMPDTYVTVTDATVTVSYNLPAMLVGANHPAIVLKGPKRNGSVSILKGTFGEARCLSRSTQTDCIIEYRGLDIDPLSVADAINAHTTDVTERIKRFDVAEIFGNEPVGIVTILK